MALNELFRSVMDRAGALALDEAEELADVAPVAGAELELELELLLELQAAIRSAALTPAAASPALFVALFVT